LGSVEIAEIDGADPAVVTDRQRLHVDNGIFSELLVNQIFEGKREGPVEDLSAGVGFVPDDGLRDELRGWLGHARLIPDSTETVVIQCAIAMTVR